MPRQARLACALFARSSFRSFVRLFVSLFVANLWTQCFENEWTDFDANWQKWSAEQGHEMFDCGGQEVKGQDHTRPKYVTKSLSTRYLKNNTIDKPGRHILR